MVGYKIDTKAWYEATRNRLVEISKELRKPETPQTVKDKLFEEQLFHVDALLKYADKKLGKNPIK